LGLPIGSGSNICLQTFCVWTLLLLSAFVTEAIPAEGHVDWRFLTRRVHRLGDFLEQLQLRNSMLHTSILISPPTCSLRATSSLYYTRLLHDVSNPYAPLYETLTMLLGYELNHSLTTPTRKIYRRSRPPGSVQPQPQHSID
jgi:hypothetical protein